MDILNYIVDEGLVLIPCFIIIASIIKHTSVIKDKYIPFIVLALGIAGAYGILGFNVNATIQGILLAGATVLSSQLVKQLGKEE